MHNPDISKRKTWLSQKTHPRNEKGSYGRTVPSSIPPASPQPSQEGSFHVGMDVLNHPTLLYISLYVALIAQSQANADQSCSKAVPFLRPHQIQRLILPVLPQSVVCELLPPWYTGAAHVVCYRLPWEVLRATHIRKGLCA